VQTTIPLGEKIMQIRTAKNLTQENLAYGIGRNAVYISRIENGQVEITPKTLTKVRRSPSVMRRVVDVGQRH